MRADNSNVRPYVGHLELHFRLAHPADEHGIRWINSESGGHIGLREALTPRKRTLNIWIRHAVIKPIAQIELHYDGGSPNKWVRTDQVFPLPGYKWNERDLIDVAILIGEWLADQFLIPEILERIPDPLFHETDDLTGKSLAQLEALERRIKLDIDRLLPEHKDLPFLYERLALVRARMEEITYSTSKSPTL